MCLSCGNKKCRGIENNGYWILYETVDYNGIHRKKTEVTKEHPLQWEEKHPSVVAFGTSYTLLNWKEL